MAASRMAGLTLGACALMLAAGCETLGGCKQPLTDATAPEIPPLKMPVGLDGPDTSKAVQIPALDHPELPRGKDDACLQEPPPMREPGSQTPPTPGGRDGESAATRPKRRGPVSPPR